MAKKVLTQKISEPLSDARTADVNIHAGSGNLMIDRLTTGENLLVSGSLQYLENQDLPVRSVLTNNGHATFKLQGSKAGQPWFRMPWAACNGATLWQVHLTPDVLVDITAHSDGGNLKLDLAGMMVTRVAADTGGGNLDVVLPEKVVNLDVNAKTGAGNVSVRIGKDIKGSGTVTAGSGAGNVTVSIPDGLVARIHASSGMGKVIIDSRFDIVENHTYQSPGYDAAVDKVEITISSGAGNASVTTN
jgi:hypothetical protein